MKTIAAAQFKEKCLALMDNVDPDGLIITKHGKPVAKLLPINSNPANLIGSQKHSIKIKGDIFSTGENWDAQS